MLASLAALIELQATDTASDAARRRLADLPAAEREIEARIASATGTLEAARTRLADSTTSRRALEKDVAVVDSRMARFDDHKAAVKTNQEYTALLSEIATAKAEKDAIEERILVLMEEGDQLSAAVKAAESALADTKREADKARAALTADRAAQEAELARLDAQRATQRTKPDARALAVYDQLLKGRRGLAVAQMTGETCAACHVRLRPTVVQAIRRNDALVQCDSCRRILYFVGPAASADAVVA